MTIAARRSAWIFCSILASLSGILAGYRLAYRWEDAYWYYQIADGRTNRVIQPFSLRQLAPLAARLLHHVSTLDLNHSFAVLGVVCLAIFSWAYFWLLQSEGVAWHWILIAGGLSFWALSFSNYMLPDLLNDALLLLFIIALMKESYLWSSLTLLPLALSRESVVLVLVCFLVVSFGKIRWTVLLGSIATTFVGLRIAKHFAAPSLQNRHQLGDLAYTVLKMPFNFAVNVLGVNPWLNTLTNHCATPIRSVLLPFHAGAIRQVGYCGFDLYSPLNLAASALCEFAPQLVALAFLLAHRRTKILDQPVYLRFCLLYGAACFLLAPLVGSAVDRLVSYSWPLFLIAVPVLACKTSKQPPTADKLAIVIFAMLVSWLFYLLGPIYHSQLGLSVLLLGTLAGDWLLWTRYFQSDFARPWAVSQTS